MTKNHQKKKKDWKQNSKKNEKQQKIIKFISIYPINWFFFLYFITYCWVNCCVPIIWQVLQFDNLGVHMC